MKSKSEERKCFATLSGYVRIYQRDATPERFNSSMSKIITSLLLLILISPFRGMSQTVHGIITDSETGEPLASATVLYEGTYRGTIANMEGEFSIDVDRLPAVLIVRYIGYKSERAVLDSTPSEPVSIALEPSVTEMDEIVVTDRDPGLSIMERVIARKQIWRSDLKTYEVDAFTRQVLRNDTEIVSITESGTRSFWDSEKGHREVQLQRRQTTNIGDDQNFAGVRFLPNFYDDNITIAGYNVVGITNPNALRYYDFRLLETLQIDGEPVYKIEVIPNRRLQPLFEGVAYVLGSEYALIEVDVKPNDVVNFPPPVQEFDLSYRQQFSNFGENFWLPVDMHIDGTIRISMIGLRFPSIRFSQTSNLSEYRVNVELPDSLYRENRLFSRAETDTTADFSQKLVPLTAEERVAYETIDSTNTLEKAFEPEGFLAGLLQDDDEDSSFSMGPGNLLPAGFSVSGRFNRVDGFNAGLKVNRTFNRLGLRSEVFGSYSFHADHFDYGLSLRQRISPEEYTPRIFLTGTFAEEIRPRSASSIFTGTMNSFQSLMGGADYFDYYKTTALTGGIELRSILPRTDLRVTFENRDDRSVEMSEDAVYDFSIFGLHRSRPGNPAIWDGTINSLKFELDLNRPRYDFGVSGSRSLRLSVERSSSEIGSDFDFTRLNVEAKWNMDTFFSRRVFANTLALQFTGGYSFGDLPPQNLAILDGTMGRFSPFGVLKTKNGRPYDGSRYWMLTGEYNFRTIPFELIGLRPLADRGWGIILFGGVGYADSPDDIYSFIPASTNGVHSEAGLSLNSIFGIFRIDLAKRIDAPGSFIGISLPRYF